MTGETWKPIPDFPGYEVSDHGRVRSLLRRIAAGKGSGTGACWCISAQPQRILKGTFRPDNYRIVVLRRDGLSYTRTVHQLVLLAFVGLCPEDMEACHNDGNPHNNHLSNLRYDTHLANQQDAKAHGSFSGHGKLSDQEILRLRADYAEGKPTRQLAKALSIDTAYVRDICAGHYYQHVGGPRTSDRRRKLIASDARRIRQAVRNGQSQLSQALKYNCSKSMISRIMKGTRYPEGAT